MGIIAKQGTWNFVIIYLGVILGVINNLFLMPKALKPFELGIVSVLLSLMLIGGQLSLFGSPQAIMKFFPRYKERRKQVGIINYILKNMMISLAVSIALYLAFKESIIAAYAETDNSSLFADYYYMFIPLLTFFVFQEFFGGYLKSLLRSVYYSIVKEIVLRVYQSSMYLLLLLDVIEFDLFLTLYVSGYLITTILNAAGVWKHSKTKLFVPYKGIKKDRKSILKYCAAIFPTGIAGALLNNIDVIMIGAMAPMFMEFSGLALAGVYGRMVFMAALIMIPFRSLVNIAVPMISRAWEKNDQVELASIYKKSSLTLTIVGTLTFIGIWANIDNVFKIFPDGFEIGKYVFLFLGLGSLMQSVLGTNGPIISNSPYYWIGGIAVPVLAILVIVTNLIFIPLYGIEGAAFATAGSRFVYSVLVYLFLFFKYKMQPISWRNIYVFCVAGATLFLVSLIPTFDTLVVDICFRTVAVLVIFVPAIMIPKISQDINEMAGSFLIRMKLKKP
ncbi:MAG: O-antigen/teichoic acid export membrane protein [Parvicellaceae bacterium]|jgi:O-antigen/teichoic acid export membrane protein